MIVIKKSYVYIHCAQDIKRTQSNRLKYKLKNMASVCISERSENLWRYNCEDTEQMYILSISVYNLF